MEKLNELVELAKELGGEQWQYNRTTPYSNGYIAGKDGRTIVETTSGDVPANACRFIEMADPATILAIAAAFGALEQRAEAAEAKLAELEKQSPVGQAVNIGGAIMVEWERCITDGTQLFTRAAPAINLAELLEVSANKTADQIYHLFDGIYDDRSIAWSLANDVWDACHAAILRNIEEAK